MPQMMPINWIILFIYFTLIFIIFITMNYFNFFNKKINFSLHKNKKTNLFWKW